MKVCTNVHCRTDFIFGNNKTVCPFCGSRLTENVANNGNEVAHFNQGINFGNEIMNIPVAEPAQQEFIVHNGRRITCRGEILEIEHHEIFCSKFHKWINAVFRGEPYQFAHQTMEYVVRVQRIADGYTGEITDFHLFGNYMGKFQVGDEVEFTAKSCGGRNIVKKAINHSIGQTISGGILLPAGFIRAITAVAIIAIILMIVSAVKYPIIPIIGVAILALPCFIRGYFRRRRWR